MSNAGCMIDTDEFGQSHFFLVGGLDRERNSDRILRWQLGDEKGWVGNQHLKIAESRSENPAVSWLQVLTLIKEGKIHAKSSFISCFLVKKNSSFNENVLMIPIRLLGLARTGTL